MTAPIRRPRIAFVTYAMHCGGMEAFLLRLGHYLRQEGCDVEVITTVEPGEWYGRLLETGLKADHVAGFDGSSPLLPLKHSRRVGLRLAAGGYDVIFLNHARYAQAALARLPEHVVAIPILHNDAEPVYAVGCANHDSWNVAVAVSPKVAATARQRVPRRPVVEILSGVDLPESAKWQRRASLVGRVELIFIGRLDHSQKGVLWLPDIYRACLDRGIDAGLTIVGDGPDAQDLERRLKDYGLSGRTRCYQGLVPEQIYDLLLDSHMLLMPSLYEGLPIALLESLACGCVPIASRLPGITDLAVEDGVSGLLVSVGDVDGFGGSAAALSADPERWSRMSRVGHERARRRFSLEVMGSAYLKLISESLDGRYPLPRRRGDQRPIDLKLFTWKDYLPQGLQRLGRRGRAWMVSRSAARASANR